MQSLEYPVFKRLNSKNSLECTCEKINLSSSRKKITVCEICSEKIFLRKNSNSISQEDFTSSLSDSN